MPAGPVGKISQPDGLLQREAVVGGELHFVGVRQRRNIPQGRRQLVPTIGSSFQPAGRRLRRCPLIQAIDRLAKHFGLGQVVARGRSLHLQLPVPCCSQLEQPLEDMREHFARVELF